MKLKQALGPLKDIYKNKNVHEIIIDSFDDVYYDDNGKLLEANNLFKSQDDIEDLVENLLRFANIKKEKDVFQYDFTLDERTRINIILPPMSIKGPSLNILKIPLQSIGWDEYIKWDAIKEEGKNLIEKIIAENKNILVAGPAGSGKTTLLNVLSNTIDKKMRVVTIERTPSLIFERKRSAKLMAPNNRVDQMPMLVEAASKMRADYLIHSYVEGPEAMNFVELVREGHSAMALLNGENIFDALKNFELKCQSSNFGRSAEDIRYAIAHAFDYIVFQEKLESGKREVTRIASIDLEDDKFKLDVIYTN